MLYLFIILYHITEHLRKKQQFSAFLTYLWAIRVYAFASLYLSKYKLNITIYGRKVSDVGLAKLKL